MQTKLGKPEVMVLWDGECPMCARSAHWLARHDRKSVLHYVAYQDAPSPPMTPALRTACSKSLHTIESNGRVLKGARAVFRVLEASRFRRLARTVAQPPWIWFAEVVYRWIAANRMHIGRFFLPNEPRMPRGKANAKSQGNCNSA